MKKRPLFLRRSNFLILSALFIIPVFYLDRPSSLAGVPGTLRGYNLKCIQMARAGQSNEGIGAIIRRNQLAFFLAQTYGARLSFPHLESEHGYQISNFFDTCPEPKDICTIHDGNVTLLRCPRGDCECHEQKLDPYIKQLAKKCTSILLFNDKSRSTEYSGCIKGSVLKYFRSNEKEPVEFDAIHLRAGDLAHSQGGKAFSDMETYFLLKAMCALSNRDIIIVTEGTPKLYVVESCSQRLVLASDTSIQDAFRIFQHAKHVAAGFSGFGILLMEMARPTHVITLERAVPFYEWVDVEHWTIIGKHGTEFHFDSKQGMVDACIRGQGLHFRSFNTIQRFQFTKQRLTVQTPLRRWTNDSTWFTSASTR